MRADPEAALPIHRIATAMNVRLLAAFFLTSCGPELQSASRPTDSDHDGVVATDLCADVPEDRDGFEDDDGCPDPDDDGDRIVDVCDLCRREAEVYNGYLDDDGCPDRGSVPLVDERLLILDVIGFARGSAQVEVDSRPILSAITAILLGHPEIERVLVAGVSRRGESHAERLASERAEAVAAELVAAGVDRTRVEARSFGDESPFEGGEIGSASHDAPFVGFVVMRVSGWDQYTWEDGRLVRSAGQPPDPDFPPPPGPAPCPSASRP